MDNPATPLSTVVIDSVFGPLVAFENDFATRQILEYGAHTRNEVALLRHFVDPDDLIYDIGAHIGSFAIPLAAAAGENGRVVAVEAEPDNFIVLCQNLRRRSLIGRVAPVHGLAGGQATRYAPHRAHQHTSATYFVADPAGEALITFALDDLHACFHAGRRAAVIKIDVEGMELSVLQSAERTIVSDRPILYVEIAVHQMARFGVRMTDIEAFLRGHNYFFFRNVGQRNSTDDLFTLAEISNLAEGGDFFDVLAIPAGNARLARARAAVAAAKTE